MKTFTLLLGLLISAPFAQAQTTTNRFEMTCKFVMFLPGSTGTTNIYFSRYRGDPGSPHIGRDFLFDISSDSQLLFPGEYLSGFDATATSDTLSGGQFPSGYFVYIAHTVGLGFSEWGGMRFHLKDAWRRDRATTHESSTGIAIPPFPGKPVKVSIERSAGSLVGKYTFEVTPGFTVTGEWWIIQISGAVVHESLNSGQLVFFVDARTDPLTKKSLPKAEIAARVNKLGNDQLAIRLSNADLLQSNLPQNVSYGASLMKREGSKLTGAVDFDDGYPDSSWPDFRYWQLDIFDNPPGLNIDRTTLTVSSPATISTSTNLKSWTPIATNQATLTVTNDAPKRFYKAE